MNLTVIMFGIFSLIFIIMFIDMFKISSKLKDIEDRIPNKERPLVTMDIMLDELKKIKPNSDGYFMEEGKKFNVTNIIEDRKDEIKVEYEVGLATSGILYERKWIPKKDFCKNYTTQELSDIIREVCKR